MLPGAQEGHLKAIFLSGSSRGGGDQASPWSRQVCQIQHMTGLQAPRSDGGRQGPEAGEHVGHVGTLILSPSIAPTPDPPLKRSRPRPAPHMQDILWPPLRATDLSPERGLWALVVSKQNLFWEPNMSHTGKWGLA